tara:strand:+ start:1689 stop:2195 length:507 start_codon:yes stop_codon:yes gene_type:complete
MAHFAKLDENNVVLRVDVLNNEVITDENEVEQEQLGIDFLKNHYKNHYGEPDSNWKQTSYNTHLGVHKLGGTPFRMNYAQIGGTYDPENDRFINVKPYSTYVGPNDKGSWDPPIPEPSVQTYTNSEGDEVRYVIDYDNDNIRWKGMKSWDEDEFNYYWNESTSSWDQI